MLPKVFDIKYGKHTYSIPLRHKFNNLYGSSAIGKTSLLTFIDTIGNGGIINLESNIPLDKIRTEVDIDRLRGISERGEECLIILDETDELLKSMLKDYTGNYDRRQVLKLIRTSNAIFLCITRKLKSYYPLPQDAVLELKNSSDGFTHTAVPFFSDKRYKFNPLSEYVLCEDRCSGYDFIKSYIANCNQVLISSNGIENMPYVLKSYNLSTSLFYDYLGAGHIVYELPRIFDEYENIYSWYSLEWYILECLGLSNEVLRILDNNNVYNKEKAIEQHLKKHIKYNKHAFDCNNDSCITPQDCTGRSVCPHSGQTPLCSNVVDCPLSTERKRFEIFSMLFDQDIDINSIPKRKTEFIFPLKKKPPQRAIPLIPV